MKRREGLRDEEGAEVQISLFVIKLTVVRLDVVIRLEVGADTLLEAEEAFRIPVPLDFQQPRIVRAMVLRLPVAKQRIDVVNVGTDGIGNRTEFLEEFVGPLYVGARLLGLVEIPDRLDLRNEERVAMCECGSRIVDLADG